MSLTSSSAPSAANTTQVFRAARSRGGEVALATAGAALALAAVCIVLGASREPSGIMLILFVLAVVSGTGAIVVGSLGLAYRCLSYALTGDALCIQWFGERMVLPYASIDGIFSGQRVSGQRPAQRLSWPGIVVGAGRVRGQGKLRFFATTQKPTALTVIATETSSLVLSAADPPAFRAALIDRIQAQGDVPAGPVTDIVRTGVVGVPWTALRDPWARWCIGLGVGLLLASIALIASSFANLPDQVALHFDASGVPNDVGAPSDLLRLPFGGAVILLVNSLISMWVHARERVLARLLWVSAAVIQGILLVAVIRLLQ